MGQEAKRKKPEDLRSHRWFGVEDLRAFGHRSRMRQMGYDQDDWKGRPVIGIINTWSDINQCHAHLRDRAQDVKTGVLQAGGLPLELPAISLSEPIVKPTTMLYRNLLAALGGGGPLEPFVPDRAYSLMFNLGDGSALWWRGPAEAIACGVNLAVRHDGTDGVQRLHHAAPAIVVE